MDTANNKQPKFRLLPYVFTLAYSIIFVQTLIIGFDRLGMVGVLVACASAYAPLGLIAGAVWRPALLPLSIVAALPATLYLAYLYGWSLKFVTTVAHGMPLVLEPLTVFVCYFIGAWTGKVIANFFTQRKLFAGQQ